MKKLLLLVGASLIFIACGSKPQTAALPDDTGKVVAGFKLGARSTPKLFEVDVKRGFYQTRKTNLQIGGNHRMIIIHDILLANFEFDPKKGEPELKEKGQVLIKITAYGDKSATEKDTLKPGTYEAFQQDDINNADHKAGMIFASKYGTDENPAKVDQYSMASTATMRGKLVIESISEDRIKGTIDIADGEARTIKGDFTANSAK